MSRRFVMLAALVLLTAMISLVTGDASEPTTDGAERWTGTYVKYARFDTRRHGRFGEAQRVTITKSDDGYRVSGAYNGRMFTEAEKGVLSDGKGGLGRIYLGSVDFSDQQRARVLRADFCYESFILYEATYESAKEPEMQSNGS
jgi:hypothetical protein